MHSGCSGPPTIRTQANQVIIIENSLRLFWSMKGTLGSPLILCTLIWAFAPFRHHPIHVQYMSIDWLVVEWPILHMCMRVCIAFLSPCLLAWALRLVHVHALLHVLGRHRSFISAYMYYRFEGCTEVDCCAAVRRVPFELISSRITVALTHLTFWLLFELEGRTRARGSIPYALSIRERIGERSRGGRGRGIFDMVCMRL